MRMYATAMPALSGRGYMRTWRNEKSEVNPLSCVISFTGPPAVTRVTNLATKIRAKMHLAMRLAETIELATPLWQRSKSTVVQTTQRAGAE
jgi:hypothetical protein